MLLIMKESHKCSRHAEVQFPLGVSVLGVHGETYHNATNGVAIRPRHEVEDLVQNVIGLAAAPTYPVVGFSRRSVFRLCARIRGKCCGPGDIGH